MNVDDEIKAAQLEKLRRELALLPRSKFGFDMLSKLAVPFLAVATAGYAFWIGLPKAQLDLLNARRDMVDSQGKLTEAEKALAGVESKRKALLEEIERLQASVDDIQKQNANTAQTLNRISQQATSPVAQVEIDKARAQVQQVENSLVQANAKLGAAAVVASNIGVKPPAYAGYNVDVFYCAEAGAGAKARAEAVLALSQGKAANWRLRELSAQANARTGYGLHEDVISHNADEQAAAQRLQADILGASGAKLRLRQVASPTPGYVSVFFCAGGP